MKYLLIVLLFSFLAACDKNDPTPELSDDIYKDYVEEFEISNRELESTQKEYNKLLIEKTKAVPQTGQIKFVQKKIYDCERQINTLKQQKQFFEIKIELRRDLARQRALESQHGGRPWPDVAEIATYKSSIKFQRDKLAWDKNKGMKKNVPRGTSATGEAPKAAGH